jgi:hypothetical protein
VGGGGALDRGGKLLEVCQALERGRSLPLCGPTHERSGGFARVWLVRLLMGCRGRWAEAGRGPCSSFNCGLFGELV